MVAGLLRQGNTESGNDTVRDIVYGTERRADSAAGVAG